MRNMMDELDVGLPRINVIIGNCDGIVRPFHPAHSLVERLCKAVRSVLLPRAIKQFRMLSILLHHSTHIKNA